MICEVNLSDLLGASDRKMKSVNFSEGRARRGRVESSGLNRGLKGRDWLGKFISRGAGWAFVRLRVSPSCAPQTCQKQNELRASLPLSSMPVL